MKNKLKEYIPLSDDQRKKIWENGIFVLDANVLLNMCRYSKKSCDELIGIIEKHKDNLWLPYQVGMEFFNNRLGVIEGIKNGFNQLLTNITKMEDVLEKELKLNDFRSDTAHNLDQLREDIKTFQTSEEKKIRKWQKEFEENDKEAILTKILSLYEGKVGDDYESTKLEELYQEGERRFKESIPPGFADWKEKIKDGKRRACGDLIWWKQTIDYARKNKCDIIIVTDDKKEDWWYKVSGKTISPRVELIREFDLETNGQSFLMYKTHQFMEVAKELDGAKVSDSSIKEAEETGAIDYSSLMKAYKVEPYNVGESLVNKYLFSGYKGALDSPIVGSTLVADPSGIQSLTGLSDGKGILGVYNPTTHVALPIEDSATGIVDFYAQHPERLVTVSKASDETSKWMDYFLKKDKK